MKKTIDPAGHFYDPVELGGCFRPDKVFDIDRHDFICDSRVPKDQ
jgi:hypothetical protein